MILATAVNIKYDNGTPKPVSQQVSEIVILLPVEPMVDANRDKQMSFDSASIRNRDQTTAKKPYRFWTNNDHDIGHEVDGNDHDEDDVKGGADHADDTIQWRRDLEDFSRLWITFKGITELVKQPGFHVKLSWKPAEGEAWAAYGTPGIRIFKAVEEDSGGSEYLENEKRALNQLDWREGPGAHNNFSKGLGTKTGLVQGNEVELPASFLSGLSEAEPNKFLLFEGTSAGKGRLVVSLYNGGEKVAEYPPVFMELLDIKDMYERWTVDSEPASPERGGSEPNKVAVPSRLRPPTGYTAAGHSRPFVYNADDREEKEYILFVHGWNMTPVEKEQFAETSYKRLFWQGYRGRFGVFEWPTTHSFDPDKKFLWVPKDVVSDPTNYDRGEWSAWRSALPLKNLLVRMNQQYPQRVNVLAHSMGNVVTGEALRLQSQSGGGKIVNTYVASQAAVPAHCYDASIAQNTALWSNLTWDYNHPDLPFGRPNFGPDTPNIYRNWFAFNNPVVGRQVNFRNLNDYALQPPTWEYNQIVKPDWQDLPEQPWDYSYLGDSEQPPSPTGFKKSHIEPRRDDQPLLVTYTLQLGTRADVQDRYEIMSFAAEARSKALGASDGVAGFEKDVELRLLWKADDSPGELRRKHGDYGAHKWHSAQFRSTNMRQKDYWKTLLGEKGFNLNTTLNP